MALLIITSANLEDSASILFHFNREMLSLDISQHLLQRLIHLEHGNHKSTKGLFLKDGNRNEPLLLTAKAQKNFRDSGSPGFQSGTEYRLGNRHVQGVSGNRFSIRP